MRRKRGIKRTFDEKAAKHIPNSPLVWPDALRQQRALMNRIHYHLREKGQRLCKYKGRYVIVDLLRRGAVVEDHVNLERLARKIGVLNVWETLAK